GLAEVAEGRPRAGVGRIAVVGVDQVAARAAARAEVAGMIVGPQERKVRVVQAGLVQVDQRRTDAQAGAGAAVRQADVRLPRLLQRIGVADLRKRRRLEDAAALEGPEVLAGLGDLPAR